MAPIHEAAERGDLVEVRRLVEEDPGRLRATQQYGYLPLYIASRHGQLAVVGYLLDQGEPINHQGRVFRQTALHKACCRGHGAIVRLLLARGADPTLTDSVACTPLYFAASCDRMEIVRCLLAHGGSPIDAVTSTSGLSALAIASFHGHAEVARLLLEAGADPTISDKDGDTPLSWARRREHPACVALLEVRGNH